MARANRKAGWVEDPKLTTTLQAIADSLPLGELCRRLGVDPDRFADPSELPWSATPPPEGDPRWDELLR